MKSGKLAGGAIFSKKRFWTPLFWLIILAFGVTFGSLFGSAEIIAASVLAAFLGLNEAGRTAYKTNLIISVSAAVAGSICGALSWVQTASLFIFLFVAGGFMLYFRDSARRFLPALEDFAEEISKEKDVAGIVSASAAKLREMGYRGRVFIAVSDGGLGLYLPGSGESGDRALKRNGGALWKVFASGRAYMTGRAEPSRDLPLDRDARSIISAPLAAGGDKLGVIQLETEAADAFTDEDLSKLQIIAFMISRMLERHVGEDAVLGGENISGAEPAVNK